MDISHQILSDVTVFMKYARYVESLGRRETWEEIVTRNKMMHIKKYPHLENEINKAYKFVYERKVLPSMRSMQFAGKPIEISPNRVFNCAYLPIDDWRAFNEIMFLLLGGTGVGYSVQNHHVEKLPEIRKPREDRKRRFLVGDSIEGWADAVKVLMRSYFEGSSYIIFDFSDIRPKGARLITSGGKAPGPEPLKICLRQIKSILNEKKDGEQLTPLEVHDIVCHIADAVLAGGIRRAALISLFSADNMDMLTCKSGTWWEKNPQRGRANNSAVLVRHRIRKKFFLNLWDRIQKSGSGEPGVFFTNDKDEGTNPCKPLRSRILTRNGYITFEEALKMRELEVVLPNGEFAKASAPFKTGQNREVYKITLSNGLSLYGTDNHLHMKYKEGWARVDELKVGDRLSYSISQRSSLCVDNSKEYENGLLAGWMFADGWNFERSDTNSKRAGLCFGSQEFDVIPLFERITNNKAKDHFQKEKTCKILQVNQTFAKKYNKDASLSWIHSESSDFKLGFLRSFFTADGSVRNQNNVEVYSIKKDWLEEVVLLLQEFGIRSTLTVHSNEKSYISSDGKQRNNKICYKINVHSGQYKRIGFLSKIKNDAVQLQKDKGLFRRKNYETITSIELDSVEDVYDITVFHDSHSFIDSGIVTHNCCEISLRPFQFCNLCEVNVSNVESQEDLNARVKAAAFIGTLQAGYTDFHYLRPIWKRTTEREALLGVGMTGIGSGIIQTFDLNQSAQVAKEENKRVAQQIGINSAARITTVKPSGTSSMVLGCSSGVHAWHAPFYKRRIRVGKNESIYNYLVNNHPELLEDDFEKPHLQAIISVPQKAPLTAILRNESAINLLERIKFFHSDWILPGHNSGNNTHNVSATISIKENEWESVGEWMWKNRDCYNGLSVLPYSDHTYVQAPFEDCSEEEYNLLMTTLKDVDLTKIYEIEDNTDLSGEIACAGGACEVKYV